MSKAIRILQLTDLHLFNDRNTKLIGVNPLQTLQRVMEKVSKDIAETPPDLIVLTGDISQDYSDASYEIASEIFNKLPYQVAATMGNHDSVEPFTKIFKKPYQKIDKTINSTNWSILTLNTHWPKHIDGMLSNENLDFLNKSLAATPSDPTIIFLHHHVLPISSNWIDQIMLKNNDQFLEIIGQYQNIKAVVCGHVHQETSLIRNGVTFLSTPSTSWQFKIGSHGFKLDTLMPGYRWLNLFEDGSFQTEVVRIDHTESFVPDLNSNGY